MNISKRLYTKTYRRSLTIIFSIASIILECYALFLLFQFYQDFAEWQTLIFAVVIHMVPSFLMAGLSKVARFSITDDVIDMLKDKNVWPPITEKLQNMQKDVFVLEKSYQAAVEKAVTVNLDEIKNTDKEAYLESKNIVMKYMMYAYPPDEVKDIRNLYYFSHLTGWFSFFMPGIGLFGCLTVYWSIVTFVKSKGLAEDYQEETSQMVEEESLPDSVKNHDAFVSNELNVEPIRDILSSDDPDMKRGAVDYLGRIATPEAVRLLRQCLADDSPEVRFMSHTMLGRIDETHIRRIKDIQNDLSKASSEDQPALQEKLGYSYKAYADSQLLEESTRDYYLKQSEKAYLANLTLSKSDDPNILYTLALIYTTLDDSENAKSYFEKGRISALKNNAYMLALRNLLGLAEWLYKESNYTELIDLIKTMPDAIEKGYQEYKQLHQDNPKNIIIRKLLFQFTFLSGRKEESQILQETFQEDDPLKDAHIGLMSFWLNRENILLEH